MNLDRYKFHCSICNQDKDSRGEKVWQKVTGYEIKREQGGTNHIALRKLLPEYVCALCMSRMQAGDHPGQGMMFG